MIYHRWRSNEDMDTLPNSPKDRCLACGVRRFTPDFLSNAAEQNEIVAGPCPGDGRLVVDGEYAR